MRGKMHVVARRQPFFDRSSFYMRGVIVHDNVNVEPVRNASVDLLEKIKKLGGSVA